MSGGGNYQLLRVNYVLSIKNNNVYFLNTCSGSGTLVKRWHLLSTYSVPGFSTKWFTIMISIYAYIYSENAH